jgi:hypothetical protein
VSTDEAARPAKKRAATKTPAPTFVCTRDTREQTGWRFPASGACLGTEERTLCTGDYSIDTHLNVVRIERKATTGEICQNLFREPRFLRELDRLAEFPVAIVMMEFSAETVLAYPAGSGIPKARWHLLRVTGQALMKKLLETMLKYPTIQWMFVGDHGPDVALSLFRRIVENFPPDGPPSE